MAAQHVAVLVSALGAGGAERVIGQLAGHWLGTGRRVTVITFDAPCAPVYHPLAKEIGLERLGVPGGGLGGNLRKIARLRHCLRRLGPDVLVSFLTKNNLLAAFAAAGLPVRWIASERNNPERQGANPLWNRLLRIAYRRADAIVCQTRAVRRCFPASVGERLEVIANPIVQQDEKIGGFAHRLTAVGRLEHQKGFDLLIQAFASIADRHPPWRLDIWGDGPEKAGLNQLIDQSGMRGRISLRGASKVPGGWMTEADVFVLPSRYEGFPNVLGEAMSAGLPVIAARCDFGPEEMIDHALSGWLVESEDIAALAAAMDVLLGNDVLQHNLAKGAREAVSRFAPERVFGQWDALLDRVCSEPRRMRAINRAETGMEPVQ